MLRFVNSADAPRLADVGTSCPDHFLRTKIKPLYANWDPAKEDVAALKTNLTSVIAAYRDDYNTYYERCKRPNSPPMRNPNPSVVLIPGCGMIAWGKTKSESRVTAEFYNCAVEVMRGAEAMSEYVALPEQEAFDIEYWALEEAKLRRSPKPKPLSSRIALITGGAGGIGKATAHRLVAEGAVVCLTDIDAGALKETEAEFAARYGKDSVRVALCNVTDEASVTESFQVCAREFGGIDIVVSNAGIAAAAAIEDTSLALWNKIIGILATGYFLVSRDGYRVMLAQGLDASIIFIASKNGVAASPGAAAYCTAKAAE